MANPGSSVMVYASISADQNLIVAAADRLTLMGFSCRESAATASVATFRLMNGSIATGTVIVPIELGPNESRSDWYPPSGVDAQNGLSIDLISGTIDIAVFYSPG